MTKKLRYSINEKDPKRIGHFGPYEFRYERLAS